MLSDQKLKESSRVFQWLLPGQAAQTEQHQTDAQHAINTEQRGVSVHGVVFKPLHVIERDRRIDQKAEQPAPTRFQNATATKNRIGQR
jgi:hypothetical protein